MDFLSGLYNISSTISFFSLTYTLSASASFSRELLLFSTIVPIISFTLVFKLASPRLSYHRIPYLLN
jgi:hypothetical protein